MTACDGCGKILGFKKYKFHRMWRIEGNYCKECMIELGREFDLHAEITISKRSCDLCKVKFYFLKSAGKQHNHYCKVCREAIMNGVIPDESQPRKPGRVPQVMMIFAGLGVTMMALGLFYTVIIAPSSQGNLLNILFGSTTTAMGFVLFRKTIRSRNLILGKAMKKVPTSVSQSKSATYGTE